MQFALTLKKNVARGVTVDKSDYDFIWQLFDTHNIKLKHINSELDSDLRLHYHGVAIIPKNFYRKKLCPKGFHINLLPLKTDDDYHRWVRYCYKDCPPEDWPDLCEDDPPAKVRVIPRFTCCNNNNIELSPRIV